MEFIKENSYSSSMVVYESLDEDNEVCFFIKGFGIYSHVYLNVEETRKLSELLIKILRDVEYE